jgi:2-polyprenyl-3-methyl-5-hydroxy-6-metoxy-1,4-benzoquinol methylase
MLRIKENIHREILAQANAYDFDVRRQHAHNKIQYHVPKHLRGRFLDIGCGPGNGVVAGLQHGFEMCIGIDRDLQEFPNFKIPFDDICYGYDVNPERALLIEADIFNLGFHLGAFDCILMLDSIEHVTNPTSFIKFAANHLKPGGVLVVDTCPLYYSKSGAHLFNYFDSNVTPWVHLRKDFSALMENANIDDWSIKRFEELNKITHDEILQTFLDSNLEVVQQHRANPTQEDVALLKKHSPMLDLAGIDVKLLFEDWVLIVGKKI